MGKAPPLALLFLGWDARCDAATPVRMHVHTCNANLRPPHPLTFPPHQPPSSAMDNRYTSFPPFLLPSIIAIHMHPCPTQPRATTSGFGGRERPLQRRCNAVSLYTLPVPMPPYTHPSSTPTPSTRHPQPHMHVHTTPHPFLNAPTTAQVHCSAPDAF